MKNMMKIVAMTLLVQLFNVNAADNSEYKDLNLQTLPKDIKNEILSFLGDPNAIPTAQTLEKIQELQNLSLVNKDLSRLAQDALKKYETRTNEYLDNLVKSGIYPLGVAIDLNTPFAAKWLKNKASESKELQRRINETLIQAAHLGDKDMVKILINAGADPNIIDLFGFSALTGAAGNGHKNIVEILINAGVNVNINRNGRTALIWAAKEGHKDIVEMLINAGAKLNIQEFTGYTALMAAAYNGDTDIVKMLINAGADLNISKDEDTALDIARKRNKTDIVKLLEKAKSKKS